MMERVFVTALLRIFSQENGLISDKTIDGLLSAFDGVFANKGILQEPEVRAVDYVTLKKLRDRAENDPHINAKLFFTKLEKALNLQASEDRKDKSPIVIGDPEGVQVRRILEAYFDPELFSSHKDMMRDFRDMPYTLKRLALPGVNNETITPAIIYRNAMLKVVDIDKLIDESPNVEPLEKRIA